MGIRSVFGAGGARLTARAAAAKRHSFVITMHNSLVLKILVLGRRNFGMHPHNFLDLDFVVVNVAKVARVLALQLGVLANRFERLVCKMNENCDLI